MWGILYENLGEIGKIKLYEPVYPEPVEEALFLMLLCLLKDPPDGSEKPFAVPWVYSFTDDPFAEPPRAPDPLALSWRIVGEDNHQQEVPDRPNFYSFTATAIETALGERWDRLQHVTENYNPLTKHFFMKAFQEQGVDR